MERNFSFEAILSFKRRKFSVLKRFSKAYDGNCFQSQSIALALPEGFLQSVSLFR